jgi:predicted O-linked N-acetylglucosamine transferase (SPINDLY family)
MTRSRFRARRIKIKSSVFLDRDRAADRIGVELGFTRWSRPGIFMHRAAPVQVNYLGYAGTLGSPVIDYVLADEVVIPPGEEKWFTEQVVRLPHSYLPNDDGREIAPATTRSLAGLSDSGFVFCAFTAAYKINPPLFDTARFSRHLEAAYFTMHQRAMRGEAPAAFTVGASR